MFNPPHWFYENTQFPTKEVDQVNSQIKRIARKPHDGEPMLTTFFFDHNKRPDNIWIPKYENIIKGMVKDMGLYSTSKYQYEFWSQYYNKDASHHCHHHAGPDPIYGSCSWVHFIRTTGAKEFVFSNKEGDYYTPKQDEGDIIIFPSYLWHQVMPKKTNSERFVVAGNFWFIYLPENGQ